MGGVTVREELGGSGLGRFDSTIIFEALATGCPRVAAFLSIHNMAVWMIDALGSRGFREQVVPNLTSMDSIASYCLTELGSGSDAAALRTRAVLDGDAYVVNGEEGFVRVVTRADNSVVLRVHAAGAGVSEPRAVFWLALTIHAHPTMSEAFHESVLAALGHPLHI
jgi:alkylation response protein AidB-like acyl-CoA dehydrogenase